MPHVQHDPEVFFVQYDNPPSAQELQQLSSGNLDGYTVAAQRTGSASSEEGIYGDDDDDLLLQLGPATPLSASAPVGQSVSGPIISLSSSISESLVTAIPLSGLLATGLDDAVFTPSGPVTLSTGLSDGFGVRSQGFGAGVGLSQLQVAEFLQDVDDDDLFFGSRLADDLNVEELPLPIHSRRGTGLGFGVPLPTFKT